MVHWEPPCPGPGKYAEVIGQFEYILWREPEAVVCGLGGQLSLSPPYTRTLSSDDVFQNVYGTVHCDHVKYDHFDSIRLIKQNNFYSIS